ncbi:MAG: hydantoinase B/oxoprolinase family protein [Bacteroidetes bacterium]|nr:hydantoinase B/oxoprolinase family protein [Rhodothermia bacterium]MCS7155322.1 hydantoinase B/oxoprolinase family protein [Bacteroidota bacterium]MCX7907585.1 hydantoinase B/oxoprolinase family protein [Bacteroidota bacterium]MDW8138579.1 hydantoinase B/oxoprolinase family protein [Bacteroidota bacterium]MDW8284484.1 hydantoinase B/oxoprolinase family protein [Bacteroidota bacterium]
MDAVRLEIFRHLLASVAEEMGAVLRRSAFSPNIKERRDFSCALFTPRGELLAQAAHIPVHLGAMPLSVQACLEAFPELEPGDAVLLNDPFRGGTHLPDLTLVHPVFVAGRLWGFVASRAHHADIGGMQPGSMPLAREIYQEGLVIPPVKLLQAGRPNPAVWELILANVRTPEERRGDLRAQLAAGERGVARFEELVRKYGPELEAAMEALLDYAERLMRRFLSELPDGTYRFEDALDDDGFSREPLPIRVAVTISGSEATVDFSGTAPQCAGPLNAVRAITVSAVYYVFRALIGQDVPTNAGCLRPIRILTEPGSLLDARPPAAVAGGNVETSQRIVDVVLGALAQALPDRIPAASQGTMNNWSIGGWDPFRQRPYAYYETLAGGAGAMPDRDGSSAVHTHMTNTLNTPVEALEYAYPFRITRYGIRDGSGGRGLRHGGDGLVRELELLAPAQITILAERRRRPPYGLAGGEPGAPGKAIWIHQGRRRRLSGKVSFWAQAGDRIRIETPGGGGWGAPAKSRYGSGASVK